MNSPPENYNFCVSNNQEDCVMYMGPVFAVLTPKDSISSKYRGYELMADGARVDPSPVLNKEVQ